MVDIHTHLLPAVDDGAETIEEALSMTEALVLQDIKTVVCTPHFYPDQLGMEDYLKKRSEAIDTIRSEKLTLIPGSETMLSESLFYYSDLRPLCIGNTNYLLLEIPFHWLRNREVLLLLDKLIRNYQLNPVIAHIERYPTLSRRRIRKLKRIGCLLQINASSVIEGQRRTIRYLKRGMIDVMASDCHNLSSRKPNLSEGYRIIENILGSELTERLKSNAENIIKGTLIKTESEYLIL